MLATTKNMDTAMLTRVGWSLQGEVCKAGRGVTDGGVKGEKEERYCSIFQ